MVEHEAGELWELIGTLQSQKQRNTATLALRWAVERLSLRGLELTRANIECSANRLWDKLPPPGEPSRTSIISGLRLLDVELKVSIWGQDFSLSESRKLYHLAAKPAPSEACAVKLATMFQLNGSLKWSRIGQSAPLQPCLKFARGSTGTNAPAIREFLEQLKTELGLGSLYPTSRQGGLTLAFQGATSVMLIQHIITPYLTPSAAKRFETFWMKPLGDLTDEHF